MKRCALLAPAILLLGCGHKTEQFVFPDQVADFTALYESSCAGCHGRDGRLGAARPLNDPVFLAVINAVTSKDELRDVIANGVPKFAMPAFAKRAGGTLTDQQISILADQIAARWSRPQDFVGVALPPYRGETGDPRAGEAVFHTYCANCHGENGGGGPKGGSVIDPAFLALVSDQFLRTTVIAGRSDRDAPDWRNDVSGHPMAPQEISDVVAWLSARRAAPAPLITTLTERGTSLP